MNTFLKVCFFSSACSELNESREPVLFTAAAKKPRTLKESPAERSQSTSPWLKMQWKDGLLGTGSQCQHFLMLKFSAITIKSTIPPQVTENVTRDSPARQGPSESKVNTGETTMNVPLGLTHVHVRPSYLFGPSWHVKLSSSTRDGLCLSCRGCWSGSRTCGHSSGAFT